MEREEELIDNQGLQKFTNSEIANRVPSSVEKHLKAIVRGGKLDLQVLYNLSKEEQDRLKTVLTAGIITLAGEDREAFIDNVDPLLSDTARNEIWERNHRLILFYLDHLTRQEGRMPSNTALAQETGLSRKTIIKHLKEYYDSPAYKEKEGQIKILRERLLMKVYDHATGGDMRAARVFLEATSEKPARINKQTNYYQQTNNHVSLTMQQLEQLPKKQREMILRLSQGG